MNRATFFAALRKRGSGVFGTSLSQAQMGVLSAILDEAERRGLSNPATAYIMATAYHEPGPTSRMVPNRENLNYSTAKRIVEVWPKRFTLASAARFVRNPRALANEVYNGRLGNRPGSDDGWVYRGGGLDHLTGRDNYRRASAIVGVDLVAHPERITDPRIAVESLVDGMVTGRYRGKKLANYCGPDGGDYVNARAIVNDDVATNGRLIAGYAASFNAALHEAGRKASAPTPPETPTSPPVTKKPASTPEFGGLAWLIATLGAGAALWLSELPEKIRLMFGG